MSQRVRLNEKTSLDVDDSGLELEGSESSAHITEPFDPALIRIETKILSVDLLVKRLSEGEIILTPGFQRRAGIWNETDQSRLIESLLIRIPLPAFYMDGTNENQWLVVDGLQRLTVLDRFINRNELRLSDLEFLGQFEGKKYGDLPRQFQRRINETQVTVSIIERGTPEKVKFNIFRRINTGGLPLSAQEIRHALYQGQITDLLEKLANSREFSLATRSGVSDRRMAARECVLRFLAFYLQPYKNYQYGDFDFFLSEVMDEINAKEKKEIELLEKEFKKSMDYSYKIFSINGFRKLYSVKGKSGHPINKALFEVWAVNLGKLEVDELDFLVKSKSLLLEKFVRLMNDDDFSSAISHGTGKAKKVKLRFSYIERIIREVINAGKNENQ